MIAFAEVPIGSGGSLGCAKCGAQSTRSPFPLTQVAEQLQRYARDWTSGPGPNVCFVDFEPFAHPDLPALISAAVAEGYERIRLRTDAGALAVAGNAPGIVAAGVRQLEVVLLGPDAPVHDALAARSGLFAAMEAGLAAVDEAVAAQGCDFLVCGRIPVCAHNVEHVPATVATLAEKGAVAVTVDVAGRSLGRRGAEVLAAAVETATVNSLAVDIVGSEFDPTWPAPWTVVGDA